MNKNNRLEEDNEKKILAKINNLQKKNKGFFKC